MVVGTTGWFGRLEEVSARVMRQRGALPWAPNFSLGIAVFAEGALSAATWLRGRAGVFTLDDVARREGP